MVLSNEEKVEIVLIAGNNYKSCRETAREFNEKHPDRPNISYVTVAKVMKSFKNCNPKFFKKTQIEEDYEDIELQVLLQIEENPKQSIRQISNNLNLTYFTVRKFLRKHHLKPYRPNFIHTILDRDKDPRLNFCDWFLQRIEGNRKFYKHLFFNDEAVFTTNGTVNSQNSRCWSRTNPKWTIECRNQYSQKINVWCGIMGNKLFGPVFFEQNINANTFLNFLETEINEILDNMPLNSRQQIIFQLDGAPCHYSILTRNWLNDRFPQKWIGRGTNNDLNIMFWPPRSPDLTPMDFFLWGYLKNQVYKTRPRDREELKQRIREECNNIPNCMLENAVKSLRKRAEKCVEEAGGHVEIL